VLDKQKFMQLMTLHSVLPIHSMLSEMHSKFESTAVRQSSSAMLSAKGVWYSDTSIDTDAQWDDADAMYLMGHEI